MITRRLRPVRTASSFAARMSWYQLNASWVRGLSSRKHCCAKLAKSARSSAEYSLVLCVLSVVMLRDALPVLRMRRGLEGCALPSRGPRTTVAHVAAQPRDQPLHDLLVGRGERVFLGRRLGFLLDVAQHVDQHLCRP